MRLVKQDQGRHLRFAINFAFKDELQLGLPPSLSLCLSIFLSSSVPLFLFPGIVLYQLSFWQYAKCAKPMRQVIFMMFPRVRNARPIKQAGV